jgi:uncharacterized protein YaaN involved in tellurite resistance
VAEPSLQNLLGPSPHPTRPEGDVAPLQAPAAVAEVAPAQAAGLVPVEAEVRTRIEARARQFVDDLVAAGVRSPAFAAKLNDIATMGQADLRTGGRAAQRMLSHDTGTGGTARVTAALASLRRIIDDLDPSRATSGVRRIFGGGDLPARYFARYRDAQVQLDAILRELVAGQDELRRDNAAIDTAQAESRAALARLSEYAALAGALDDTLMERIGTLSAQGGADAAGVLRDEALTAVRQRRQDVLTHLAVAAQGHLALDVVRRNNLELIRGVELARRGTVRALRAAVAASAAVAHEQLVLDRISALDRAAAAEVTGESGESGGAGALGDAFRELMATMDDLDRYRTEARANLDATTEAVRRQGAGRSVP